MKRAMRRMRKQLLVIACIALVAGLAIGGTIAWLQDSTEPVQNTFAPTDISIKLEETPNADSDDTDTENDHWEAELVPGSEYAKDPKVTVEANSEKCYLFVKVEETNSPSTYLEYTYKFATDGWTQLGTTTTTGDVATSIWYRVVGESTTDQEWNLLTGSTDNANGYVKVRDTVGTAEATGDGVVPMPSEEEAPSITFTAYAIQFANITATDSKPVEQVAWELASAQQ